MLYNLISSIASVGAGVFAWLAVHALSEQEAASWFAGLCVWLVCESICYAASAVIKELRDQKNLPLERSR